MVSGRTVRKSHHQIGVTHKEQDKNLKALTPGRRVSQTGQKYTENRKNRSDMSRKRRL